MFSSFDHPLSQLPQYSSYSVTEERPAVSPSFSVFAVGFLAGIAATVLTGVLVALWMLSRVNAAD